MNIGKIIIAHGTDITVPCLLILSAVRILLKFTYKSAKIINTIKTQKAA